MDQRALAHAAQLSLPTIQRMEASEGVIRGTVDSLMKLIAAIEAGGVQLINDGEASPIGGRGVRMIDSTAATRPRRPSRPDSRAPHSLGLMAATSPPKTGARRWIAGRRRSTKG
jgi:hypothetical protein